MTKRRPTFECRKVAEYKTDRYRVDLEFYGTDARFSPATVLKRAEWFLAYNGAVVTSLKPVKVPGTSDTIQLFEWSIRDAATLRAVRRQPGSTIRRLMAEQLGIDPTHIRFVRSPSHRWSRSGQVVTGRCAAVIRSKRAVCSDDPSAGRLHTPRQKKNVPADRGNAGPWPDDTSGAGGGGGATGSGATGGGGTSGGAGGEGGGDTGRGGAGTW